MGARYTAGRLSVEGEVRGLVTHEDSGYEEWGGSGTVRLEPDASGRGLSLSLSPVWGQVSSGAERLWSARSAGALTGADELQAQGRLEGELGYGLGLGGAPGQVTPYAGFATDDGGSRAWRTGARWQIAPDAALELEAVRRGSAGDNAPAHSLTLRGALRW